MGRTTEFHSSVLYHGTSSLLNDGDYLEPTGPKSREQKYVWSTPDINHAHDYASGEYEEKPVKLGYVYEVHPDEGDVTTSPLHSPSSAGAKDVQELNKNVRSSKKVKVGKKVRTVLPIVKKA